MLTNVSPGRHTASRECWRGAFLGSSQVRLAGMAAHAACPMRLARTQRGIFG